jgi:hypothetical protein
MIDEAVLTVLRDFNVRIQKLENQTQPQPVQTTIKTTVPDFTDIKKEILSQVEQKLVEQSNEIKRNITNVLTLKLESMIHNTMTEFNNKINASSLKLETMISELNDKVCTPPHIEDAIPENPTTAEEDDLNLELMTVGEKNKNKKKRN